MAGLHLRLADDEKMIVNGAGLHFLTAAEFRFTNKVRFVYGSQLMSPADANNTARKIYLAIQTAYVGEPVERESALDQACLIIALYRETTTSAAAKALLGHIQTNAEAGRFYTAMQAARRLVRHEDHVLGLAAKQPSGKDRDPG